jgi:hypothetical protein
MVMKQVRPLHPRMIAHVGSHVNPTFGWQAPPVGTLWIFTVVQLSLGRAVLCLTAVLVWCWRNGMKLAP